MDSPTNVINEEWIRKKLNITHDNLDDIKTLSLPGTYQEKITHLGNSLNKFTRLKELDLSRNSLVSLEGLENLKLLEKLNLYYNNISSLRELERLKYNTSLAELDLRLNPITKEENDYRLFLINNIPSLKILDDRAIREGERQMAAALLNQNSLDSKLNGNHKSAYENTNNPVISRVKSVTNIAKRSAGLNDNDMDDNDVGSFRNILNLRLHDSDNEKGYFDKRQPTAEEYSPRTLKEIGNLESQSYNGLVHCNNNRNNNNKKNIDDDDFNSKDLVRTKSCSMLNLRSLNVETSDLYYKRESNKAKSVHFNDVASYHDLNSYRSSSDNHLNQMDESEAYTNFKARGNFTPNPYYDKQEKEMETNNLSKRKLAKNSDSDQDIISKHNTDPKNQIFSLLDLVDRYWNGSKSLHKNFKFLSAASQIISNNTSNSNHNHNDDHLSSYQAQIKLLQDENRRLQHQLLQKNHLKNDKESESQYKNLLSEVEILKKKYQASLDENKELRIELNEKIEKQQQKDSALENFESQNNVMKRDIEIMKIKLKQYEQLQQLTVMLQESHKSLVSTNEHLLQEINTQKQYSKTSSGRFSYTNEIDLYPVSYQHDGLIPQMYLNQDQQCLQSKTLRKQLEQLSNKPITNSSGRYTYSVVK